MVLFSCQSLRPPAAHLSDSPVAPAAVQHPCHRAAGGCPRQIVCLPRLSPSRISTTSRPTYDIALPYPHHRYVYLCFDENDLPSSIHPTLLGRLRQCARRSGRTLLLFIEPDHSLAPAQGREARPADASARPTRAGRAPASEPEFVYHAVRRATSATPHAHIYCVGRRPVCRAGLPQWRRLGDACEESSCPPRRFISVPPTSLCPCVVVATAKPRIEEAGQSRLPLFCPRDPHWARRRSLPPACLRPRVSDLVC